MERNSKQAPYLVFSLGLSVFALSLLATEAAFRLDEDTRHILDVADLVLCGFFFVDFLVSLYRSENRWRYLATWGWLDLLSSIPMVDALRVGRAARIIRNFRVLRGVRSTRVLASFVLEKRAQSGFLAAALVSMILVVFSSVAVLHFERNEDKANITEPEDAMWWSVVTLTTVGYGDRYPVTSEGRIVAAMLMFAGVGLFGTLSGFIAAWFLAPSRKKEESEVEELRRDIRELRELLLEARRTGP